MSQLDDALSWSGIDAVLIMFVVYPRELTIDVPRPDTPSDSSVVRWYDLDDVEGRLLGRSCREYDLVFNRTPPNLESVISAWLTEALLAGAECAWFAFEGSFDFSHIWTEDTATQVFAVGTRAGIELAIDDEYREGAEWAALLESLRADLDL